MCEQVDGTSQANQSAAVWCAAGAQQKDQDDSGKDISVHIHPQLLYFFSLLARTLHNIHTWEDIELKF